MNARVLILILSVLTLVGLIPLLMAEGDPDVEPSRSSGDEKGVAVLPPEPLPPEPDPQPEVVKVEEPEKERKEEKKAPKPEPEEPKQVPEREPEFPVDPVDGEPDLPITREEIKASEYIQFPRGGFFFETELPGGGGVTRGVGIPGAILMKMGLVEFFGCAKGSGKEHETIVFLDCDIQEVDLGLTMAGLERGPLPLKLGIPELVEESLSDEGQGARVLVFVRWREGKDGPVRTFRAEDLVVNQNRSVVMPRVGWTYVGSWREVPNPTDPEGKEVSRILEASNSRLLLSTWRNQAALLDNPMPDAIDPNAYCANLDVLPEPGTAILVYFRSPTEAELKEIVETEKTHLASAAGGAPGHGHDHDHGGDKEDHEH